MELLNRPSHFLAAGPNLHKLYFPHRVTNISRPAQPALECNDPYSSPLDETTGSSSSDEPPYLLDLSATEQKYLFDDFDLSLLTDEPSEDDTPTACKEEAQLAPIVPVSSNGIDAEKSAQAEYVPKATLRSCCQGRTTEPGAMIRSDSWEGRLYTAQYLLNTAVAHGYRKYGNTKAPSKPIPSTVAKGAVKLEPVPAELKFQSKIRRRRDIDWKVRKDRKAFQKVLRNRQAAQRSNEKRRRVRRQYQQEMEKLYDERLQLEARKEELIRLNQQLREKVVAKYSCP